MGTYRHVRENGWFVTKQSCNPKFGKPGRMQRINMITGTWKKTGHLFWGRMYTSIHTDVYIYIELHIHIFIIYMYI